ncbi:MAG: TonB-dependent receptor [Acidobacteriota bacterium]|nr:TonB-dependent receptor [Acidobacteriota bacterium]
MQLTDYLRKAQWALTAFVLLFCATAQGQIITSTILGHVSDSSGAVVPGAEVTVTNEGTGISNKVTTDSAGLYSVSALVAGVYSVAVSQQGFETFRALDVQLLSAHTVRVDVTLKIGASRQVVTVTGAGPMVHTDSGSVGTVVSQQQMAELPMPIQDVDALLKLTPGAMWGQSVSNPRINGSAYWGGNNFTLNGALADDTGNGGGPYASQLSEISLPQLDSLQEYRVDSIDNNAEYSRLATITLVTKAGSNQFHGDLYAINGNAALNANSFTSNATGLARVPYVRNTFGFNVGGPIKRDKLFFFVGYSDFMNHTAATETLSQPSANMHQGNFGALCTTFNSSGVCTTGTQLYNPLTGAPFQNNIIPTSMFASQATTLLTYLPTPTLSTAGLPGGANDLFSYNTVRQDERSLSVRMDLKVSNKDMLYGTFLQAAPGPWQQAQAYTKTYGNFQAYPEENYGFTLAENHTFSPTTLNELRGAFFDKSTWAIGQNQALNPSTLFPLLTPGYNRGMPTMAITGYTGMFYDYGTGPRYHGPDIQFTDNFTHVKGRHTFKLGADEAGFKAYQPSFGGGLGSFSFNGQWTAGKGWSGAGVTPSAGNAFADFLLGYPSSDTLSPPGVFGRNLYDRQWAFYGQDTWQATKRLTFHYGLRYEYQAPWWFPTDGGVGISTYYDPTTNKIALPENSSTPFFPPVGASPVQYAAYPFTTTKALGLGIHWLKPDRNNFAPRIGLAYRPFGNNNTVFRGGYGVYYGFEPSFIGNDNMTHNPPWLAGSVGQGTTFSSALPGHPPAAGYQPDITFANPFPSTLAAQTAAGNPNITYMQQNFVNPVAQQWNLTVEHQFAGNWMGRITYFGSQTHHIQWYGIDINVPVTQTANVSTQAQRPLQPWGTISGVRSGGKQNLDDLQIEVTKRFSQGLNIQSYYVWTRSLDNATASGGIQDWHLPNLEYGNTEYVRRHTFNVAYVYQLPFGRGKHYLGNAHGALNTVLGGWELTGDTVYATGVPFSVSFTAPASKVGWLSGRADRLSGTSAYQGQVRSSHDVISGVPWFNVNAFAPPTPWAFGDSQRNTLWGPGFNNWDVAMLKDFRIPGREGLRLQFRSEFLNAPNHFNLGTPNATIADTRDGGSPVPAAGTITSCSPNCPYGSRFIQFGLKLIY